MPLFWDLHRHFGPPDFRQYVFLTLTILWLERPDSFISVDGCTDLELALLAIFLLRVVFCEASEQGARSIDRKDLVLAPKYI